MNEGTEIRRSHLLNVPTGADVTVDVTADLIEITGLLPIKIEDFIRVVFVPYVAEVSQVVSVGLDTPTIIGNTIYKLYIGYKAGRREGAQNQLLPYSVVSNAILTGNAAADRYNVYTALAAKINLQTLTNQVTAKSKFTIAQTNSVAFTVGEIVTETATGATAVNLSGTTGTLTLSPISGTFSGIATGTSTSGTLTGSLGGLTTATAHVVVAGISLTITDNPGYMLPVISTPKQERGLSTILPATNPDGSGFNNADVTVSTVGVYGVGAGAVVAASQPQTDLLDANLRKGDWVYPDSELALASNNYDHYEVYSKPVVDSQAASGIGGFYKMVQTIWANGSVNAGYTEFKAAMNALPLGIGAIPGSPYSLGLGAGYSTLSGTTLTLTNPQFFATGNTGETTKVGTSTYGTGSDLGTTGLSAAKAAVLSLYNTLKALSGTAIPTPAAIESDDYGYGVGVFVPGVYTTASAIGMTAAKTITLKGLGDYVFVSTGGAITFGATDNIVLANGAVASRVFWVANNAITTGATDVLKGNFMSGAAGAITVGATNNIEGRLLSPVAVTIDGTATDIYLPLA